MSKFIPYLNNGTNIVLSRLKNFIKCVFFRKNFVLIFFEKSNLVFVLEFLDDKGKTKVKISNIELLPHKTMEFSYIDINEDLTKMILVNGELDEKYYISLQEK